MLTSMKGYIPVLLAIYDYWYIQRRRSKSDNSSHPNGRTLINFWPAMFLTAGYTVKAYVMGPPRSTYICPLSSSANVGVPIMQVLSVLLDCYVLIRISGIAGSAKVEASTKSDNPSVIIGSSFLVIRDAAVRFKFSLTLKSSSFPPWSCPSAVCSRSVLIASTG